MPRNLFRENLRLIDGLRPSHQHDTERELGIMSVDGRGASGDEKPGTKKFVSIGCNSYSHYDQFKPIINKMFSIANFYFKVLQDRIISVYLFLKSAMVADDLAETLS